MVKGMTIEKAEIIVVKEDGLYLKDIVSGRERLWDGEVDKFVMEGT